MAHTTVLYCPTTDCDEYAVDVVLRYAAGRWWADTDLCPACGRGLSENPNGEKCSPRPDGLSEFALKDEGAVADVLPRDRRARVSG